MEKREEIRFWDLNGYKGTLSKAINTVQICTYDLISFQTDLYIEMTTTLQFEMDSFDNLSIFNFIIFGLYFIPKKIVHTEIQFDWF